ncbi:MAG: acyl carrier protein [Planctomycetaceae bacterium]|jgi:acyl carrier protein|nr:acyl carrier protein [Planctomycetaceae bacterium]
MTKTKQEFIDELECILNTESGALTESVELVSLQGWDSTGMLGVIAVLDDLDVQVPVSQIRDSRTVADLIKLAGDAVM